MEVAMREVDAPTITDELIGAIREGVHDERAQRHGVDNADRD
jgi:hypothetical protein